MPKLALYLDALEVQRAKLASNDAGQLHEQIVALVVFLGQNEHHEPCQKAVVL